jgi:aldose 1-epimerase
MTQPTRRTFLQAAALTGAGLITPNCFALPRFRKGRNNMTRNRNEPDTGMYLTRSEFGKTADGKTVDMFKLDNGNGITVEVLSLGGVIYSFNVPDKNVKTNNISANLETVADHEKQRPFFGALVGSYGNRIANGKFTLEGNEYNLPTNNGPNSLHGGNKGFDTVVWKVTPIKERNSVGILLKYTAQDGEEGYPGKLDVAVLYSLTRDGRWVMDYTAKTSKTTVLNLTNHTFWNLAGFPNTNHEHILTLNADKFLPTDNTLIPTGVLQPVEGTPLDFRKPHKIGERIAQVEGDHFAGGYDHCYILTQEKPNKMTFCADVYEPASGRTMRVETTEPGVQLYTGNFLNGSSKAFGHSYEKHGAFCLETQHFPNSPNQPEFPSTVLKPGQTFRSKTVHTFGVK